LVSDLDRPVNENLVSADVAVGGHAKVDSFNCAVSEPAGPISAHWLEIHVRLASECPESGDILLLSIHEMMW
jgi:hypothetical protein